MPDDSRPRGRWFGFIAPVAIASVVVLAAWSAWHWLKPGEPNIAGYQHAKAPHQSHQAGGEGCRPKRLARLPNRKRAIEAERCAEAEDSDKASAETLDYAARSANAAEQAVLVANYQAEVMFWQTFATAWAFLAAAAAAWYAKRAADDTGRSAKAAADAAQAAVAQHRPWLMVRIDSFNPLAWRGGNVHQDFNVFIKNDGNTPANNIEIWTLMVCGGNGVPFTQAFAKAPARGMQGFSLFGGDSTTQTAHGGLIQDEINAATATSNMVGHIDVGVIVYVTYDFVGGKGKSIRAYDICGGFLNRINIQTLPIAAKDMRLNHFGIMDVFE